MSNISLKVGDTGGVTLVEETALTEVGNFSMEYDASFLRDVFTLTPKANCNVDQFIEQAGLVQSKLPRDAKVVIDAFVLPRPKTAEGPAW